MEEGMREETRFMDSSHLKSFGSKDRQPPNGGLREKLAFRDFSAFENTIPCQDMP